MKLAEALSMRSAVLRELEALRTRIADNARYQEGEEPAEDAAALLVDAEAAVQEWQRLIQAINRTNAATEMGADGTLTDALGRRDALRWRRHLLTTAADAAAGSGKQQGYARQLRSELKMLAALPVSDLRAQADQAARDLRELDVRIQQKNWETDLLDE